MWRFDMWRKGYGSYDEIDQGVANGKITPGKPYPDRNNQLENMIDEENIETKKNVL